MMGCDLHFIAVFSTVVIVLFLQVAKVTSSSPISIAAFNVQTFGRTKAAKPDVMDTIAKIIRRYDVILIQEIRDKKGHVLEQLLELVNAGSVSHHYEMIVSRRLGRSNSKEQYAFFYRKSDAFQVVGSHHYADVYDEFEREPFVLRVRFHDATDVAMIAVHIDPDVALQENNALRRVYDDVTQRWGIRNVLILGDLNADCKFVNQKERKKLYLQPPDFHWLIPDGTDTTVKSTHCAYDRFIASGDELLNAIVPGSAKVFRFDVSYRLDYSQTLSVSDHYPIEMNVEFTGIDKWSPRKHKRKYEDDPTWTPYDRNEL